MRQKFAREGRRALTVHEACKIAGFGKTMMYEAINDGRVIARKLNAKTLILREDLETFLHSLPRCPTRGGLAGSLARLNDALDRVRRPVAAAWMLKRVMALCAAKPPSARSIEVLAADLETLRMVWRQSPHQVQAALLTELVCAYFGVSVEDLNEQN